MNSQQEAVALWKYLESRQIRPSVRKVIGMLRAAQVPVSDTNVANWLSGFVRQNPHPKATRTKKPAQTPHSKKHTDSTPVAQKQHKVCAVNSTDTALYARHKEPLISKTELNTSYLIPPAAPLSFLSASPELGDEVQPAKPSTETKPVRKPKLKREGPPSAHDLAAYAILHQAWPIVSEHVEIALPITTWKGHNKAAALSLHEAGKTPEDVTRMLIVAYTYPKADPWYSSVSRLDKLQEFWPKLVAIETNGIGAGNPDEPDVYEHAGRADLDAILGPENDPKPFLALVR